MSEKNKEIIRRYFDVGNTGDVDVYDEIVAPDVTFHGMEVASVDELKRKGEEVLGAFPDMKLTVDLAVAEGDRVGARVTATGTHTGEFEGIPPTGMSFETTEMDFFRIADDRIVEVWHLYDAFGMMSQLGLMEDG